MSIRLRGTLQRPTGPRFDLYERYVGEPRNRRHVHGYAAFVGGYVLGLLGVAAYVATDMGGAPDFTVRGFAIAPSAVGLALAMLGVGLRLPVRRRGVQASVVGLLVALASVAAFVVIYPGRWTTATHVSGGVIMAYTAGVAIVAAGAATHPTAADARSAVATLTSLLYEASVLEMDDAAVELHRGPEGWTWRLVDRNGAPLVESVGAYPDRAAAREALDTLSAHGPEGWVSVAD